MTQNASHDDRPGRYLLGLLSEAERERWEEGLLHDRNAFEATVAAEDDLFDAYARGELARRERAAFERSFLVREGALERIAFARALSAVVKRRGRVAARPAAGDEAETPARRAPWLSAGVLRWAAAATVVLAVGGAALFGWRDSELGGRLAELEAAHRAAEAESVRLAGERDRLAARLAEERDARAAEREQWAAQLDEATREGEDLRERGERLAGEIERLRRAAPPRATAVSFLLTLATRSATEVPELVMAPETGRVHLQLDTGVPEPYPAYRATLYAPPGGALAWSRTGLPPASGVSGAGPTVELDLPAEIFDPGRYELVLEGVPAGAEPELVGDFEFEVVRR